MTNTYKKPFSESYVIALTSKHCKLAVDTSIERTLARIADFDGNREKSEEIFKTLARLQALKNSILQFEIVDTEEI